MRDSKLMARAYGEEKKETSNEGPDIQIKDIPQLKKDLNYLINNEGVEDKIYDHIYLLTLLSFIILTYNFVYLKRFKEMM